MEQTAPTLPIDLHPQDVSGLVAHDEHHAEMPDEEYEQASEGWFGSESVAFLTSLVAHFGVVIALALWPVLERVDEQAVVLVSPPPEYEQEQLETVQEVTYSEVPQQQIGANSDAVGELASAAAPSLAEKPEIPSPLEMEPQELATRDLNNLFSQPAAPVVMSEVRKGRVGEGTQGAAGAVDRLTFEILQSLEERPTLVVWLFDESGSLHRQRGEIRDRFDRIYEELGIIEKSGSRAFQRGDDDDAPLLTSIIGFGQEVHLLTEQPTADLAEIKKAVDGIETDTSGIERVFSAIYLAADRFKKYRRGGHSGPERNVLLITVTDERGDDADGLEATIDLCRRYAMPVYVIGVPAPFGREASYVKYVDPDPQYDQSPRWAQVDQGPESLLPERIQIGYAANFEEEPVVDSGFGPFALTRMCYETGGIYFTVHPNRNVNRRIRSGEIAPFAARMEHFFDPAVMARYRPDYVSPEDYRRQVQASPLRRALITAAQQSRIEAFQPPTLRFVKRNEAQLAGDLTRAQQVAARLEPRLWALHETIKQGEAAREQESAPRWQAGFDLAYGKILAAKVRTETYNAMLAKAKRGMPFSDPKNNTWVLVPDDAVSVGSTYEREAEKARQLLQAVVDDHPGTPWALLAEQELSTPIGWKWSEQFTNLDPPARPNRGNNNNPPRPARDEQAQMLQRPPPMRPIPKL